MGTQTIVGPTLAEAITTVETAQTNLTNADNADAVTSFNASLDTLIASATAAKVSRTPAPTGN